MGLRPEYIQYKPFGCFEYDASGEGMVKSVYDIFTTNQSGFCKQLYNKTSEIFANYKKGRRYFRYIITEEAIKY